MKKKEKKGSDTLRREKRHRSKLEADRAFRGYSKWEIRRCGETVTEGKGVER